MIATLLSLCLLAPATAPSGSVVTQPASAPSTRPTLADLRREALVADRLEIAQLPTAPARKRDGLFKVRLERGVLAIVPAVEPTDGVVAVDVTDWPGLATFSLVGPPNARSFHLIHRRFDVDDRISQYVHLIAGPQNLQLSCDSESMTSSRSVQLIQNATFGGPEEPPMRLYVNERSLESDAPGVDRIIAAESLDDLRTREPAMFRDYLAPLLREIGATDLARGTDARATIGVIEPWLTPAPTAAAEVEAILIALDSDAYRDRAAAQQRLANLGDDAAIVLLRRDRSALPPEPAAAVRAFLAPYSTVPPADAETRRNDALFLLDALSSVDARRRTVVLDKLRQLAPDLPPIDASADVEAFDRQVEAARQAWLAKSGPSTKPA